MQLNVISKDFFKVVFVVAYMVARVADIVAYATTVFLQIYFDV